MNANVEPDKGAILVLPLQKSQLQKQNSSTLETKRSLRKHQPLVIKSQEGRKQNIVPFILLVFQHHKEDFSDHPFRISLDPLILKFLNPDPFLQVQNFVPTGLTPSPPLRKLGFSKRKNDFKHIISNFKHMIISWDWVRPPSLEPNSNFNRECFFQGSRRLEPFLEVLECFVTY